MPLRMGFVMAPAYVVDTGHESEFECFRQERLRLLEPRGSDFLQVGIGLLHRLGCGRLRQQGGHGLNQASAGLPGGVAPQTIPTERWHAYRQNAFNLTPWA
jgi:hypothetical protein